MAEDNSNIKLSFLSEPDPEEYIWKYVDLKRFISFLMEEKLYLSRLDYFPDAHEGISIEHILTFNMGGDSDKPRPNFLGQLFNEPSLHGLPGRNDHHGEQLREVQRQYFGNSWFIGQRESAAMWSIYSNPDSVAISIKYKDLKDIFLKKKFWFKNQLQSPDLLLGKIEYLDFFNYTDNGGEASQITTGFYKDLSYKHEQEFRIILKLGEGSEENDPPKGGGGRDEQLDPDMDFAGIDLKLEGFNELPFSIVFHPSANHWSKQNIRDLLQRLELPFDTKNSEIKWRLF